MFEGVSATHSPAVEVSHPGAILLYGRSNMYCTMLRMHNIRTEQDAAGATNSSMRLHSVFRASPPCPSSVPVLRARPPRLSIGCPSSVPCRMEISQEHQEPASAGQCPIGLAQHVSWDQQQIACFLSLIPFAISIHNLIHNLSPRPPSPRRSLLSDSPVLPADSLRARTTYHAVCFGAPLLRRAPKPAPVNHPMVCTPPYVVCRPQSVNGPMTY
jgi:hypothetical protein